MPRWINCAGTRCGMCPTLRIQRCAKMTIRERASRFAHTDAAFLPDSSRHSRRALHDSDWPLMGRHIACESCANDVHAAKTLDRSSGKTSRRSRRSHEPRCCEARCGKHFFARRCARWPDWRGTSRAVAAPQLRIWLGQLHGDAIASSIAVDAFGIQHRICVGNGGGQRLGDAASIPMMMVSVSKSAFTEAEPGEQSLSLEKRFVWKQRERFLDFALLKDSSSGQILLLILKTKSLDIYKPSGYRMAASHAAHQFRRWRLCHATPKERLA